jgi:hypothetical protein
LFVKSSFPLCSAFLFSSSPLSAEEFSRLIRSGDPEDLKILARALSRPDKTRV